MPDRFPISEHARAGGLALAERETPEQRRRRMAPARAASIVSKRKAAARRIAAEIAVIEAGLGATADEKVRANLKQRVDRDRQKLAELETFLAEAEQTA